MRAIIRKLILATIILSTTQQFKILNFPLSIFQIMLILCFVVSMIDICKQGKIYKGRYLAFVAVNLFSSIIAYFISSNEEWAKSYFLLGLMVTVLIFIIPQYFGYEDLLSLEKALIRSQYITILLSMYSFFMYYRGGIPKVIRIAIFTIQLDEDFLSRASISGQVRLALPYATPPVLSVAMAMCIALLIFNKKLYRKRKRIALLVCFTIILILTGSRAGIIGLLIVLGIYIIRYYKKFLKSRKFLFILLGIMIGGIVLAITFRDNIYLNKFVSRFRNINLMEDRHFLVPLDGMIIWGSSIKNFLIGIGFGSSINMMGAHTYLPPYFLNNYVTLIAERGIAGVVMVIELVSLAYYGVKQLKLHDERITSIWMCLFTGLVSGIFYENLNCYLLIIILSICFMMSLKGKKNGKNICNNSNL